MTYQASHRRYEHMKYNRCGASGLLLPALSLGLWHNFGDMDPTETGRQILRKAFDAGVTHFDLANNYGPPYGSAEENFGKILRKDFLPYRRELVISTKAGYDMWPGPYGNWGSRKYLLTSLDESLQRMSLDYVDIFYSHRFDPETPLEETMGALDHAVRQGKALYAGISNYPPEATQKAAAILRNLGTPCLIHQAKYSMFERWVENGLLDALEKNGIGCIAFSPLAQGLLTNKYLKGIPDKSRAGKAYGYLWPEHVTEEKMKKVRELDRLAAERNQSLAQMALSWVLKDSRVTSALIGVSSPEQLHDSLKCLERPDFTEGELQRIADILKG